MKKAQRPAQGLSYEGGRPREEDILTRKPTPFWDRIKWLLLLAVLWLILVWSIMADNPLVGFADAVRIQVQLGTWVFVLFGLELVHQIHLLISEHWAAYNQFWVNKVWGASERLTHRKFSPWTRYRLGRIARWVLFIVVIAIITGKIIHTAPLLALLKIPAIIWHAMPFVIQVVFFLFFAVAQFALLFWFLSRGGVDVYYPDDIKTRFSDVWGQDHVLEKVKENIIFLENPEVVEDRGGYVPGGILLWGPPGTGKTLMAEAVAGETGKPYVFVDPGAFINMFFGVGVLKVKGLFRKLRKLALRYGGVIVFFDEADSLGSRTATTQGLPGGVAGSSVFSSGGCHGFSYTSVDTQWQLFQNVVGAHRADSGPAVKRARQILPVGGAGGAGGMGGMGTLEALLTELTGLKKPRGFINRHVRRLFGMRPKPPPKYRILVMMATNLVSALDPALLRPGRIDRIYRVGYPSKAGRVRTYEGYLDKVQHELTAEQVDKLAVITPYATGATIKDLVNEALITAIRDGRDVITWPDVIKAKHLKELGPPEDVEYIERERHAVAVHEACHAIVAYRTRQHEQIDIATIEKANDYLGMVASVKPEDQFTTWRSEFESDILVFLASLAGERMFFDTDSSSGVSGDLEGATMIASLMEGFFGMGQTVSSFATGRLLQMGTPGGPGGPGGPGKGTNEDPQAHARRMLADRIEDNLSTLLVRVDVILRDNERHVLALAHALETYKTLSGEDVTAVFECQRGPLVDGTPYADDEFIARLREYHLAAARAHHEHAAPALSLPVAPAPAWASSVAFGDGYGTTASGSAGGAVDGPFDGSGSGMVDGTPNGSAEGTASGPAEGTASGPAEGTPNGPADGTPNGSHGGAPTYDPPLYGPPDGQT